MVSLNFVFDGISSESMGIYLIRTNSGLFSMPFVSSRDVKEDYPYKSRSPYFFGTQQQLPTITLTFSTLANNMTSNKLKEIASWLFQSEYKEFYSEDNPDKIYYLMAVNEINFQTNGNNEGYLEVQFKSKYPYALTLPETVEIDLSSNTTSTTIKIENRCNAYKYYYPEIEFTTVTPTTSVTFTNTSDSNRLTSFTGLTVGETVYVDNQKKQIISSLSNYLYDDFNKNWLRLIQGDNKITVVGKCTLTFRMQFPVFT